MSSYPRDSLMVRLISRKTYDDIDMFLARTIHKAAPSRGQGRFRSEAAPTCQPHIFRTLHEIQEVILSHTTLTTCTDHDALLVYRSGHKNTGPPRSW